MHRHIAVKIIFVTVQRINIDSGISAVAEQCGEEKFYDKGTPYAVIAEEFQKNYQDDIVLASVNRHGLHQLCKAP